MRSHPKTTIHDPKPKKSLGQHFLRDGTIVESILDLAAVGPDDRVLEIGPGTGALTAPLLSRGASVTAVELDSDLAQRLRQTFRESSALSLLEGNILEMDTDAFLRQSGYLDGAYKVVANIPYYITAPIIRMLLALSIRPERIVLMVQEEVADRLAAPPGSMSLLSLMAQYYSRVTKDIFVPKTAFYPVPKVDSAVVSLIPTRRCSPDDDRAVFRVARIGFSARRKTLANNLSSGLRLPRTSVETVLAGLGLDSRIRAQELSVSEWISLADRVRNTLEDESDGN